jgi:hypothetical protein
MERADDICFPIVIAVLDGKPEAFAFDEHADVGEVIQVGNRDRRDHKAALVLCYHEAFSHET